MTRELEELFDLGNEEVSTGEEQAIAEALIEENREKVFKFQEERDEIDIIDKALPMVQDLEANDKEMDDLAQKATDKFNELMDLGMNVESRFSGKIFETASQMLGHAIVAKNAKIDKKLRMIELQLKKARLDLLREKQDGSGNIEEAEGQILNRNDLLKAILEKNDK